MFGQFFKVVFDSTFFLPLISIASFLIIFYLRKLSKHWENRSVPYVPASIISDFKNFILPRKNFGIIIEDVYKKFPNERFAGYYMFYSPALAIRDPDLIGRMMINDFPHFHDRFTKMDVMSDLDHHLFSLNGNRWKTIRAKISPAFSSGKLKLMLNLMQQCNRVLHDQIREKSVNSRSIDVRELMARFSIDIIGMCAFGLEFSALTKPDSEYRRIGKEMFAPTLKMAVTNAIRFTWPKLLGYLKIELIPTNHKAFFFDLLKRSEEIRKSEAVRRNDFIQLMLDIKDKELPNDMVKSDEDDVMFDDKMMASNMFLFFIAGFETTATTLSYCLYELALNQNVQDKLRAEIIKVKNEHNGDISYVALKKIDYMEMCLNEILRLFNPATASMRICTKKYRIPDSNVILYPGDRIFIPVHAIHHDEKYYPQPDKFDPERFSEENIAKRPPHTFLPFGEGPRVCIGVRFAMLEMKVCLSSLILKYKFETCDETPIPIKIDQTAPFYSPVGGVPLRITQIED